MISRVRLRQSLQAAGVVACLLVAGILGWVVVDSVHRDAVQVRPRGEPPRWVSREAEPGRFWVILPVHGALAGVALYGAWATARRATRE